MALLFKTWREGDLGRFLLGWFRLCPARGLTDVTGQETAESDYLGKEFCRVPRDHPFFVSGYDTDVDLAVGRRNL